MGTFITNANSEILTEGYYKCLVENGAAKIIKISTPISGVVTVPSKIAGYPVKAIQAGAFSGEENITGIILPSTLEAIDNYAFAGCSKLVSISIPDSVVSIGGYVFRNTGYYNNPANWQNDVLYIGKYLIEARDTLSGSYTIKTGTTKVADCAFENCHSLTGVTIPNSMKKLSYGMFYFCNNLTSVVLANGVTEIGDFAFGLCTNLKNINIPTSVKTIGQGAFYRCEGLTAITISGGVETIGDNAFELCVSLNSVTMSAGLKKIGEKAFSWCRSLQSITLPMGLKEIEDYAFEYCYALKTANLNSNIEDIGDYAFANCSELENINLPESIGFIGEAAFRNCVNLINVKLPGIPDIWNETFYGCTKLEAITIPYTVTYVGIDAFGNCDNLRDITVYSTDCTINASGGFSPNTTYYGFSGSTTEIMAKNLGAKFVDLSKTHKHTYDNLPCKDYITCTICGKKETNVSTHVLFECYGTCVNCGKRIRKDEHIFTIYPTKKATFKKNGTLTKKCLCCPEKSKSTIKRIKSVKLSATAYTYDGKAKKPTVTVKNSAGKKLKKDTDYTLKYSKGRKAIGTYKVTVTLKGNYSGKKVLNFKINPVKTKISKVTAGKKNLKIKVAKKTKEVSGYEIQYSTSKKFKSAKKATIKKAKTTSAVIKKLKAKKTYYLRIRTYKTVSGKKYYSAWSKALKKKTK